MCDDLIRSMLQAIWKDKEKAQKKKTKKEEEEED